MEIKKAQTLVNDILDLCAQLEDDTLNDACSGIYNDVYYSKSVEAVLACARELMVFINDTDWYGLEDVKEETENIYNNLLEEADDF